MSEPDFGSLHPDDVVNHLPNSEAKTPGDQAESGQSKEETEARSEQKFRPQDAILTEIGELLGISTADKVYETLRDTKDPRSHGLDPNKVKEICAKAGYSAESRGKLLEALHHYHDDKTYKSIASQIHMGARSGEEISSLTPEILDTEDIEDIRSSLMNLEWPLAACGVPGYTAFDSWADS